MSTASKPIIQIIGLALNIFVSRGGDGNLLHELNIIKAETREAQNSAFLLPFFLISTASIGLVRYTLGHTLANILTLQSVYTQNHGHKYQNEDPKLSTSDFQLSRQLVNSLRQLYAHLGLRILVQGLYIATFYQLSKTVVTSVLTMTILRPAKVRPIAEIVATVLLAEAHMYWTQATVSLRKSSLKGRLWTHDHKRWKKLVLPCVAQGSAIVILDWVSRSLPDLSGPSNGDISRTLSAIAVLRAFIAFIVRFFVLAPATAWLTLVEASCLDSRQETLVYDGEKERFVSISAVFATYEQKGSAELWKGVSLHLCLLLLELHIKKCAVQMVLGGLVFSIVHLVS